MSPTLLLLGLPWLTGTGDFLSRGWQQLSWWMFMHWALCKDRLDKEVIDRAVFNCQCLPLCFEGPLSEESRHEGFIHLSPCDLNESLYYPVFNQVKQYNKHYQSLSIRKQSESRLLLTMSLSGQCTERKENQKKPWNRLHQYHTKIQ